MKFYLSLILLLASLPAFAQGGHGVGNGGNGVVCYTDSSRGQIRSVELFDYWEMRQRYPALSTLNLGPAHLSVSEKIKIFTDRLAHFDADIANAFAQQANMIAENIQYYLEDNIPVVNDDQSPLTPSAPCYKEQFAVQFKNPAPGSRRFVIKRALYLSAQTSNDTRAGLILHEVIYRHAIVKHQHTNSDGSRLFNYLFSGNPLAAGLEEQVQLALAQTKISLKKQLDFIRIPGIQKPLVAFDGLLLRDFSHDHPAYTFNLKKGENVHINKNNASDWVVVLKASIKTNGLKNREIGTVFISVDGSEYSYRTYSNRSSRRLNTPVGSIDCHIGTIKSSGLVTLCGTTSEVKLQLGSLDVVIPATQIVNVLSFNNQGVLTELYIDSDASVVLPILFDNVKRKLNGKITVDSKGRATSGGLAGSGPFVIKQKLIYASTFYSSAENRIILGGNNPVFIQETPEKNGQPLIVTNDNEKNLIVEKLCTIDRGYTDAFAGYGEFTSTTKNITVVGSKKLYNYIEGKSEVHTDEVVKIIDKAWCGLRKFEI